jgi:PKD repeat protein
VGAALVVALVLALAGPAAAQGPTYDFTVSPNPPNVNEVTTFAYVSSSGRKADVEWDLNGNGFYESEGRTVTRTYTVRGPVTVRMRVRDDEGDVIRTVTKTIEVNGPPAVDYSFTPANPMEQEAVAFAATATDAEGDAVTLSWRFGDGDTATGASPSHAFDNAGNYTVVVTARDEHGLTATRTRTVTVRDDPGPAASFSFAPQAPLTGDLVTFTSSSTPSQGTIKELDWDLDGDGQFDDAQGETVTWTFDQAGTHQVLLRVEQANGETSVAFADVTVAQRPAPAPPAGNPQVGPPAGGDGTGTPVVPERPAARRRLRMMRPLPVVRIAGVVLPNGARVQILSVKAPRGASVRLRCRGAGCPKGMVAKTSARRVVRFRRFERRLLAGITIEIFVRKPGFIGKYTRFKIRAGEPPARVDRCLVPGQARPRRCP